MGRLTKSIDEFGNESIYEYAGLNRRLGVIDNGNNETYTLDYLSPYVNILEVQIPKATEKYVYGLDS